MSKAGGKNTPANKPRLGMRKRWQVINENGRVIKSFKREHDAWEYIQNREKITPHQTI